VSEETLAEVYLGEDYEKKYGVGYVPKLEDFSPPGVRRLLGHYYANQALGAGARVELRKIWERNGRPGDSLEAFIEVVLRGSFSTHP